MLTIPIQVSGDCWNNADHVQQILNQTQPGDAVMLDLCSEGPSLHRLGVVEMLNKYSLQVSVTRWSNGIESVPYQRVMCNVNSHFFPMSHHYWPDVILANSADAQYRFALFLGRGCASRNRILYDVYHQYRRHFLLSKMPCQRGNPWGVKQVPGQQTQEIMQNWFDDPETACSWLEQCPVTSIDNHSVQDQFGVPEISSGDMARSLLRHYHQFNVELVCETYTLGETFFPTEKTVRPIVGNKPFVVYGPANYLNNLRQRGFETFHDVWDESYDQYEGQHRWHAIQQLIKHTVSMSDNEWKHILSLCQEKTVHNRNLVRKMIRDIKGI